MNLTPKQLTILRLIRDYRIAHGYSPTMQELADELGVSKVTVFEHVEALIKKGALKREANKARSLSINENAALPDQERELESRPGIPSSVSRRPISCVWRTSWGPASASEDRPSPSRWMVTP
ncbi:MAG: LexA family protein [Planctomycetota bacterium]|jgi:SOS-response transcriptional repressor LexA